MYGEPPGHAASRPGTAIRRAPCRFPFREDGWGLPFNLKVMVRAGERWREHALGCCNNYVQRRMMPAELQHRRMGNSGPPDLQNRPARQMTAEDRSDLPAVDQSGADRHVLQDRASIHLS